MFSLTHRPSIVFILISSLVFSPSITYAQQGTVLGLPKPGAMVELSPAYVPVLIKGLKVHQDNPLAMDFIVDTGDSGLKLDQADDKQELSNESEKLIKYFLAALTLPEKDVWVNLSPYEKDRIIPVELGKTEMGRDMLAEDYLLKQITASLIYPEKRLGKDFWDKVYRQAYQRFGTTQVPVNTFNKVWIVADRAKVYENKDTAFIIDSHLKVMLEQDYLSLAKHQSLTTSVGTNGLGSQIVREIILPALEKEVNQGRNFANLRQIFYSLIMAKWYKQTLKQALLNQVYSNKSKLAGVNLDDKTITRRIYAQYLRAYKKGVFNFIKEDVDQATRQPLPRKYFSGGVVGDVAMTVTHDLAAGSQAEQPTGKFVLVQNMVARASLGESNGDAQLSSLASFLKGQGYNVPGDGDSAYDENTTVGISPANSGLLRAYENRRLRREEEKDAAMAAENHKYWEHNSEFIENVHTVQTATDAAKLWSSQELDRLQKENNDIKIENWEDGIVLKAREYLESKYIGGEFPGDIRVKFNESPQLENGYGYAIDHARNIIYMSRGFYFELQKKSYEERSDFFVRKSIFLLSSSPEEGEKNEADYAYDHDQDKVKGLFPEGSDPKTLAEGIAEEILLDKIDTRDTRPSYYKRFYESLAKFILGQQPKAVTYVESDAVKDIKPEVNKIVNGGGIAVIRAGELAIRANREVYKRVVGALRTMVINALDGRVDYIQGDRQSTAQISSKFNPMTIAHTGITILAAYALAGVASYRANVTAEDFRKLDVFKSFGVRLSLAKTEIKNFFHNAVTIIGITDEIRKWNGEEVAIILASKINGAFKAAKKLYRYLYTAGGDHYYIWAPYNAGKKDELPTLVGFDEVSDASRRNYLFYAGFDEGNKYGLSWKEYKRLVSLQIKYGDRVFFDQNIKLNEEQQKLGLTTLNMDLRKKVIEAILGAETEEQMNKVLSTATILPRLDTAGKMVLARKALPHIDFVLAHTIRKGENFGDLLRDHLIKENELKVFNIEGLGTPVAASKTREGLIAFLYGIVNFNLLYGASKATLKQIFDPADRGPLETLLRQSPLELPLSISNMLHDNEPKHKRLLAGLRQKIDPIIQGAKVEEIRTDFQLDNLGGILDRGKSIIAITKGNGLLFQIEYQITNDFGQEGNPVNKLVFRVDQNALDKRSAAKVEKSVLTYIKEYNDVKDSAMTAPEKTFSADKAQLTPGGIDFNSNQLQLSIQKQGAGVGIKFDPELIKKFESPDFQGFMPVIINISPIDNISSILGLSEEKETALH